MSFSNMFFAVICWLCSSIFAGIAIWAFKSKDPIHFWSGSTVHPDEITDIPGYNRANGWMWSIYTIGMVVTGIVSLFNIIISVILLVVICIPGTVILIFTYNHIYKKYKSPIASFIRGKTATKTPKGIIIAITVFVGVIVVFVGILFYFGSQDPKVLIHDHTIQIKAMYGENIDLSDIKDITLIEESMEEIGIGTRTNGYGGIGGALKGDFESKELGDTLLFVQAHSSPTIKIDRIEKKDVYISLSNSHNTKLLYDKLISSLSTK